MRSEYDIYTAVTFLFIGLGSGAIVALLFAPRHERIVPVRMPGSSIHHST